MTEKTLLIDEDEQRIRRMLHDYLRGSGYKILEARDGEEATDIFYANNSKIDCVVLDIMMPKKDGMAVLEEIRECSHVPVIMLTAKGEEYDQLSAFRMGADDYVTKPFSLTLLAARIEAVIKRSMKEQEEIVEIGDIKIDKRRTAVFVEGKEIKLTPKEYELLCYFALNIGATLSREQILNSVWNYDYCGDLRTVDTHVKQLRAKLKDCCSYIRTIYGFGYRFDKR